MSKKTIIAITALLMGCVGFYAAAQNPTQAPPDQANQQPMNTQPGNEDNLRNAPGATQTPGVNRPPNVAPNMETQPAPQAQQEANGPAQPAQANRAVWVVVAIICLAILAYFIYRITGGDETPRSGPGGTTPSGRI